jgi:hypothetical protein
VFTHPLITKHEKRITWLKYSNETVKTVSFRSFFLQKTVKFLPHKNIFTHSFVSTDDYSMSEVLNQGLENVYFLKSSIGDYTHYAVFHYTPYNSKWLLSSRL